MRKYLAVSKKYPTFASLLENAVVAQLVEHNFPKVGVAGPSPVYRSFSPFLFIFQLLLSSFSATSRKHLNGSFSSWLLTFVL